MCGSVYVCVCVSERVCVCMCVSVLCVCVNERECVCMWGGHGVYSHSMLLLMQYTIVDHYS